MTAEGAVFGAVSLHVHGFCFVCVWNISRNSWTGLRQIHNEDVFGPSLGRAWRSEVKGQGHEGQKRHFRPSAASVRFMFRKTSLASGFFREKACMQYFCDFTMISRKKSTDFVNTNRLRTDCIWLTLFILTKVQWNSFPKSRSLYTQSRGEIICSDKNLLMLWSWLSRVHGATASLRRKKVKLLVEIRSFQCQILCHIYGSMPCMKWLNRAAQNSLGITAAAGRFRDHSMFSVLD